MRLPPTCRQPRVEDRRLERIPPASSRRPKPAPSPDTGAPASDLRPLSASLRSPATECQLEGSRSLGSSCKSFSSMELELLAPPVTSDSKDRPYHPPHSAINRKVFQNHKKGLCEPPVPSDSKDRPLLPVWGRFFKALKRAYVRTTSKVSPSGLATSFIFRNPKKITKIKTSSQALKALRVFISL